MKDYFIYTCPLGIISLGTSFAKLDLFVVSCAETELELIGVSYG